MGNYQVMNGQRYDRGILDAAREAMETGGRIAKHETPAITDEIYDGNNAVRTETEDRTVQYIYDHPDQFNFTPAARAKFEHDNRSAGAINGWKTRNANVTKHGEEDLKLQKGTASQLAARISQQS